MTAEEAITRSILHNEIVHLPYDEALQRDLMSVSDDYADTAECIEFWGTTDDGDDWRVHLDFE